jgi:branched-chain amino acid transport system substrate-binding protein
VAQRPVRVKALYASATAIDAREFPDGGTFLTSFRKRFGGDPVWGAQYAYDAVYALADAARQAQTFDGPTLVTTLKRIEPITRVNQQLRFAPSGEQVYPNIAIYKSDAGNWAMQMMSATW